MQFTEEQDRALTVLQGTIHAEEPEQVVLEGYAGTGKSTIIQELVRRNPKVRFALTAPTNKAVKVLREKNAEAGLDTDSMTIYKLLGVRPGNSDEKRSLRRDPKEKDTSANYHVIVIDECSMLGDEIMGYIQKHLRHKKLIYVGDPKQLPPVGEELSQAFGIRKKAILNTVMRQRSENPIIALTADIRAMLDAGTVNWDAFVPAAGSDNAGIYKAEGALDDWLIDAFTSDEFAEDNDRFRYLAWTNRTVSRVNGFVRKAVYGHGAPRFVEGERLLFRKPAFQKAGGMSRILFNTDDEAVIRGIDRATIGPDRIPCWELMMAADGCNEAVPVHVVHEDGMTLYVEQEARLKELARQDRSAWPDYFAFLEQFADVQSVYAMTVHRSQGSTFDSVFVDIPDIRMNRGNLPEMLKLLYVAASRPRRFLVI